MTSLNGTQVLGAAEMASDRRSLRWVDPQFQRRYALLLLSIVVLVSVLLIGTFWFHSGLVMNTLKNAGVLPEHGLYLLIEKQMTSLLLGVSLVAILFSVFILVMANFLSHRIVGPLSAIKRSLECIGRGDLDGARLKLRQDDEFHDVAAMVNSLVDQVSERRT